MDQIDLNQKIKGLRENIPTILFLLGFFIVIIMAFNLLLSTSFTNNSGKITDQAASTQETASTKNEDVKFEVVDEVLEDSEYSIYFVQPGDSTWKIAEEMLGSGQRYTEIEDLNDLTHNQHLDIGHIIFVAIDGSQVAGGAEDAFVQAPDDSMIAPSKTQEAKNLDYKIIAGDSLWKIASENLDNPFLWQQIYEINSEILGSNPDLIFPGTVIKLPVL